MGCAIFESLNGALEIDGQQNENLERRISEDISAWVIRREGNDNVIGNAARNLQRQHQGNEGNPQHESQQRQRVPQQRDIRLFMTARKGRREVRIVPRPQLISRRMTYIFATIVVTNRCRKHVVSDSYLYVVFRQSVCSHYLYCFDRRDDYW